MINTTSTAEIAAIAEAEPVAEDPVVEAVDEVVVIEPPAESPEETAAVVELIPDDVPAQPEVAAVDASTPAPYAQPARPRTMKLTIGNYQLDVWLLAGKQVISSLPPHGGPIPLPPRPFTLVLTGDVNEAYLLAVTDPMTLQALRAINRPVVRSVGTAAAIKDGDVPVASEFSTIEADADFFLDVRTPDEASSELLAVRLRAELGDTPLVMTTTWGALIDNYSDGMVRIETLGGKALTDCPPTTLVVFLETPVTRTLNHVTGLEIPLRFGAH